MHHARQRPARSTRGILGVRRISGLIAACVLAMGTVLLGALPAGAHAELEDTSPKDGATLTTAPQELSFKFGEDLIDDGNAITLTPAGTDERLSLADPEVDGPTISVAWPDVAPAGEFTAAYRVVSVDGHPVEGSITFTVEQATGAAGPDPGAASPSVVVAVPNAQTGPPSAVASAGPSPSATPSGASPESQPEAGVLAWVLGIGVVALIGALAATWVTRRTKRP